MSNATFTLFVLLSVGMFTLGYALGCSDAYIMCHGFKVETEKLK